MKPTARIPIAGTILALPLATVAALPSWHGDPDRDSADLAADGIVRVMQPTAFADDRITDLATDLRNSSSSIGAAHIIIDGVVQTIFAVDGDGLHVASRDKGSVIPNLTLNTLREPPAAPDARSERARHQGPAQAGVTASSAPFRVMMHVDHLRRIYVAI